jgi:hypothetical protein
MLILYETTLILTDVAMSNKVEREEVIYMATKQEFVELIGRVFADDEFRTKLQSDPVPVGAAKEAGLQLTPKQQEQLESADLKSLVTDVDTRISKIF